MADRPYKILRNCKGCGKKFVVKHKLRMYCDKCRQKKTRKSPAKKKGSGSRKPSSKKKKR